jgi:hypothetical protein
MNVRMKILRFDLSRDEKPPWGEHEVASGTPMPSTTSSGTRTPRWPAGA